MSELPGPAPDRGLPVVHASTISFGPILMGHELTPDRPPRLPHIAKLYTTADLLRQATACGFTHSNTIGHTSALPTIMACIDDTQMLHH